jgi:hypothetical protein
MSHIKEPGLIQFIDASWREGHALFKRHWRAYLWIMLLSAVIMPIFSFLISSIVSGVASESLRTIISGIWLLIFILVTSAAFIGFIRTVNEDNAKNYNLLTILQKSYADFGIVVLTLIIVGGLAYLCIILGTIFLILPGIFFTVVFQFFMYHVILENKYWLKPFEESFAFVMKRWWRIFAADFVFALVLGALFAGIFLIVGVEVITQPGADFSNSTLMQLTYFTYVDQPLYMLLLQLPIVIVYFYHLGLYRVLKREIK